MTNMLTATTLMTACLFLLSLSNLAHAGKLYKWVDENGTVSYQDTPPPEGANQVQESDLKKATQNIPSATNSVDTNVTIYTVDNCDLCELIKLKLHRWNVPFTEKSLRDRLVQKKILAATSSLVAPTVEIDEHITTDISEENLKALLEKAGYLTDKYETSPSQNLEEPVDTYQQFAPNTDHPAT